MVFFVEYALAIGNIGLIKLTFIRRTVLSPGSAENEVEKGEEIQYNG